MTKLIALLLIFLQCALSVSAFPLCTSASRVSMQAMRLYGAREAVAAYGKNRPNPRKGSSYDMNEEDLARQFNALAEAVGGQDAATEIVQTWPDVLVLDSTRVANNMEVFAQFIFCPNMVISSLYVMYRVSPTDQVLND